MSGWIGVDLDGTLAYYKGWKGATTIGRPIPAMVDRVKQWLEEGLTVKVFTARANPKDINAPEAIKAIKAWCVEHIGQELQVTCEKDHSMVELYDDRAVPIIPNTGLIGLRKTTLDTPDEEDIYNKSLL